ncbi:MAG: type II toxin-antitoxin system PemK/MazF family toxin [Halanaerobiaceae bacterium]
MDVIRGDVFYADLNPVIGSEQGGVRPVLIIQNDIGNKYSPTVIVAAITSKIDKAKLPTHIEITAEKSNLEKDSVILLEQIRTVDKKRLQRHVTRLNDTIMEKVNKAVEISLGLIDL